MLSVVKRVKDRTISRLDGAQYRLKYVVNVHGWHFISFSWVIAHDESIIGADIPFDNTPTTTSLAQPNERTQTLVLC